MSAEHSDAIFIARPFISWSHLSCFPEEKLQIRERFPGAVSQECPLLPKGLSLEFGAWWWGFGGQGGGCLFTQVLCLHGVNPSSFRTEWVMGSQVEPIPFRSERALPADGLSGF